MSATEQSRLTDAERDLLCDAIVAYNWPRTGTSGTPATAPWRMERHIYPAVERILAERESVEQRGFAEAVEVEWENGNLTREAADRLIAMAVSGRAESPTKGLTAAETSCAVVVRSPDTACGELAVGVISWFDDDEWHVPMCRVHLHSFTQPDGES